MDKLKTLIKAFHPSLREGYVPFPDIVEKEKQQYAMGDRRERGMGLCFGGVGIGDCGGSTTSTNKTTELNNTLTQIMSSTVQSCAQEATMSQEISQSGSYNIMSDVTQSQAMHFTLTCQQGGSTTDNVTDALTAAIKAQADSTGQILSGSNTSADNESTISNSVKSVVNDSSMQTMCDSLNAAQGVDQSGNHNIMTGITQSQTATMVADQCANMINKIGVVNELNASADTGASATTEGLGALLGSIVYIVYLFVIIGAFFFYKIFIADDSSTPLPQYRPQPPPQYRPPPQYAAPQYGAPPQYAPPPPAPPAQYAAPQYGPPPAPPPPQAPSAPTQAPQAPSAPTQAPQAPSAPVPQAPPLSA